MEGVEEMIASLLHGLLYLSEDFAGPLDQSQLHEGISSLTPEEILSLYGLAGGLACEHRMPGQEEFRSIDWEKIISGFQRSRLNVQFVDCRPRAIAVPDLVSRLVKYLPITITSPVCINQH